MARCFPCWDKLLSSIQVPGLRRSSQHQGGRHISIPVQWKNAQLSPFLRCVWIPWKGHCCEQVVDVCYVSTNVNIHMLVSRNIWKNIYQQQMRAAYFCPDIVKCVKKISGDFLQYSPTKCSSIYSACWKEGWEVIESSCIGNYTQKQYLIARDFLISQRARKTMWLESKQSWSNSTLK